MATRGSSSGPFWERRAGESGEAVGKGCNPALWHITQHPLAHRAAFWVSWPSPRQKPRQVYN